MRFSQGASYGRYGELYNPEIFNDREEVIVFKREEFGWVFRSMMKQIGYINDIDLKLSSLDEYKLIGLWPQIMERIHIIDVNIEDFLMQEPIQTHLDAYLFNQTKFSSPEPLESGVKVAEKPLGIDWFK
jgi:hypothetical protein